MAAKQEDEPRSLDAIFEEKVRTPKMTVEAAPRTVPGLINSKPEDDKAPAAELLNWWQAANVHLLTEFLKAPSQERKSDGMLLCDAPGLGKTLSVLSTIASTAMDDDKLVIIFAGKGIINDVWIAQIARHFDPKVSGLEIFCADSEHSKHDAASPISTRAPGSQGGVYVDERPTGRLPDNDTLRTFSVLVFAKEMLSQRDPPDANAPLTNIYRVKKLASSTRLIVVDESHNLNKHSITRQELHLLELPDVPKLLLSGTPGTTPAELYRLLRIVRHPSLTVKKKKKGRLNSAAAAAAAAGVQVASDIIQSEKEWRGKYFEPKSDLVLPNQVAPLVELLKSCFLHSPESVWPSKIKMSTERIELFPAEVESYNFALSLHQRDVLRAKPDRKQPDEWASTRPSKDGWYHEPKKKKPGELPKPSGEKTMGDLMRAANGGECWSLALPEGVSKFSAPEGIKKALHRNFDPMAELPSCMKCGVEVPGLLTLPCNCPGEVCAECFVSCKCDKFERKQIGKQAGAKKCPAKPGCKRKQRSYDAWESEQPRLILQTDEARTREQEIKKSRKLQLEEQKKAREKNKEGAEEGEGGAAQGLPAKLTKQQPNARPMPPLLVPPALATISDKQIVKRAKDWGHGAGGKLVYLTKELRDLAKKGDGAAKVYITPPANTGVRARFVEALGALVGTHALADLNVKTAVKAADAKAYHLKKWKRGYGCYWQCQCCGEEHEECTKKCTTGTCCVVFDEDDEDDMDAEAPVVAHRHLKDVAKLDAQGSVIAQAGGPRIGDRVAVYKPGTEEVVGNGTVRHLGTCNGKPQGTGQPGCLRKAPADSCFVLVLNPQTMEGLDLGIATHAFQIEPILREDKEKQAQARGQRLGGARKLEIVQLLMAGTIEEKQYAHTPAFRPRVCVTYDIPRACNGRYSDLDELRERAAGKKKGDAAELIGKQATMLNALKLLRPEAPDTDYEDADEEEEDGEANAAGAADDAAEQSMVVDDADEDVEAAAAMVDGDVVFDATEDEEDDAGPPPSKKARGKRPASAATPVKLESSAGPSGPPPGFRAREVEVPPEVSAAGNDLLDVENRIPMSHVAPHFHAAAIAKWRRAVGKACSVAELAKLLLELREGLLDHLRGVSLFRAGWQTGGEAHRQWSQAVLAADLNVEDLRTLTEELMGARAPENERAGSPPPAAGGGSSSEPMLQDGAPATQLRKKRARVETSGPEPVAVGAQPSAQPSAQPGAQPSTQPSLQTMLKELKQAFEADCMEKEEYETTKKAIMNKYFNL